MVERIPHGQATPEAMAYDEPAIDKLSKVMGSRFALIVRCDNTLPEPKGVDILEYNRSWSVEVKEL
jgi:hypothetical protein